MSYVICFDTYIDNVNLFNKNKNCIFLLLVPKVNTEKLFRKYVQIYILFVSDRGMQRLHSYSSY